MHKCISPHRDYDHMVETISLVNNFKVEKVIFNCVPYNEMGKVIKPQGWENPHKKLELTIKNMKRR